MTIMSVALAVLLQTAPSTSLPPPAKLATSPPPAAEAAVARMVALYDEVCLQTFPIDGGVDRLITAKGATALTPEQVGTTLVDDPGRGWEIKDGERSIFVFLELPPFHACSVRRFLPAGLPALHPYCAVADRFEADHPGFAPIAPYDTDRDDIHVHAVGEQRLLAAQDTEALFVLGQHVTDPAKRAAGQTAVKLRFVHQILTGP